MLRLTDPRTNTQFNDKQVTEPLAFQGRWQLWWCHGQYAADRTAPAWRHLPFDLHHGHLFCLEPQFIHTFNYTTRKSNSLKGLNCATVLTAEHVQAPRLFGRRSYFVELCSRSSQISNTEFWQFSRTGNYLKWNCLQVVKHTQCSRGASWLRAI